MKIKTKVSILFGAVLIVMIAGCKKEENTVARGVSNRNDVQSVLEQGMTGADETSGPGETSGPDDTAGPEVTRESEDTDNNMTGSADGQDGIDVDLTKLSSTMVYSEVYNMMYYPEDYIGKTVKMQGMYAGYHDENTDKYYHACIIKDATACCAQGIEFEPAGEYKYPDDYPEEGQEVCVTGVFDTYNEGENKYCTLREAKMD